MKLKLVRLHLKCSEITHPRQKIESFFHVSATEKKKTEMKHIEGECLIIRSYVGVVVFIIHSLHRGYFH